MPILISELKQHIIDSRLKTQIEKQQQESLQNIINQIPPLVDQETDKSVIDSNQ